MSVSTLILLSDRIGDALFATPALAWLSKNLNEKLDMLAPNPVVAEVFSHNPIVHQLFIAKTQKNLAQLAASYKTVISLSKNQATQDLIEQINRPDLHQIPDDNHPIARYEFFMQYIRKLCPESAPHTTPMQYQLFPQTTHQTAAINLLQEAGLTPDHFLLACHMGCHRMAKLGKQFWRRTLDPSGSKSWFTEGYQAITSHLMLEKPHVKILLIGALGERKLAKTLFNFPNTVDLFGKTDLLTLAAIIKQSHLLLTCDTGPLHIACAMETPLIALFGKTDPRVWGPYPSQTDRIIIQRESMDTIDIDTVYHTLSHTIDTLSSGKI